MKYVFHPEALAEYADAVRYYTEQRTEVAQAFIDAIEDAVYRVRESPTRGNLMLETNNISNITISVFLRLPYTYN